MDLLASNGGKKAYVELILIDEKIMMIKYGFLGWFLLDE